MKKVIFFTPHFLPKLGGVEKHVAKVSEVLINRDWNVEVVTVQESEDQPLNEKIKNISIIRIPLTSQVNKFAVWKWVKKYFNTIPTTSIIHLHDVGWWVLPQLIGNIKNNFYITFHGWEGNFPVRWQAKIHRLFISWLVKDSIHVGSFIQKYYWDRPKYIVYGGVDLPIQSTISSISNPLKVVFLGRLIRENSIESYIQVLTELAKLHIKVEVTWVGDGEFRSLCEKWGNVTGMVENTRKYVQKADIVFSNSYLSILESQAQGKIVCSLYHHQLKKDYLETYPASEELVIADNPESMAYEIKNLIENQEKFKSLSKKSARFGQSQTWNLVADVYEKLWQK